MPAFPALEALRSTAADVSLVLYDVAPLSEITLAYSDGRKIRLPCHVRMHPRPAAFEEPAFTPSPVQRRILTALASGPKTATQLRAMPRIGPHLYDKPRGGMHELRDRGAVDRIDGKFTLTEYGEELEEEFGDE